jgi:hypothetical protein
MLMKKVNFHTSTIQSIHKLLTCGKTNMRMWINGWLGTVYSLPEQLSHARESKTHLRLALIMVLVGLVTIWGAIIRNSFHTTAPPVAAFDDQWGHATEAPLEQMEIDTSPKPVRTEVITPPEPEVKAPEVKAPEVKVVRNQKPEPKKEINICTRHGMHKVFTKGGKSWRCRK